MDSSENEKESGQVQDESIEALDVDIVTESKKPSEQMVPQSKVNELVGIAKKKAYEKALKELEAQQRNNMQQQEEVQPDAQTQVDTDNVIAEKAREAAAREFEELRAKQLREEFYQSFAGKLKSTKDDVEDFDQKVDGFDFNKYQAEMYLANQFPDTARIVSILAQDPEKLSRIRFALTNEDADLAYKLMQNLQTSIDANKEAQRNKANVAEPLDRLKPSQNAGGDGGDLTVRDYKSMFTG